MLVFQRLLSAPRVCHQAPLRRQHYATLVLCKSSPISEAPTEASRSPVSELQRRLTRKGKTRSELRDPANIGATYTHELSTKDHGGSVSLDDFMRLPVSAYYELDPNMIKPLPGSRFALVVPRVHLFNVWVEPLVETEVEAQPDQIIIRALNCRIDGSDLVMNLGLDNRFCVEFQAKLTWVPGQQPLPGSPPPEASPGRGGFLPFGWGSRPDSGPQGRVKGQVDLQVFSEVLGPFNLMPRPVLEGGGSAVMAVLVRTLLPLFLRRLAEDYQHWATDATYRAARGRRKD